MEGGVVRQEFPIVAAGTGSLWIVGVVARVLVGLLVLFAYLLYSSRNTVFEVSSGGLGIQKSMYGRTIPFQDLDGCPKRPGEVRYGAGGGGSRSARPGPAQLRPGECVVGGADALVFRA
jgi:hypothetical protein